MDYAAARSSVEKVLSAMPTCFPGDAWVVLEEYTIEREWGWVMFYDSKLHHDTDDTQYLVLGNTPYVVRRSDGKIFSTGTAHQVEYYIQELELAGFLP